MSTQHLSDEAIAAFADGVLGGHPRERARRHTERCAECAHAVAVQREAIWALRAAPAPALPSALVDRLRAVPQTTPIRVVPTAIAPDGSTVFAAFGTRLAPMAAAVPLPAAVGSGRTEPRSRVRPVVMTAATVAAAGVLAVSSAAHSSPRRAVPTRAGSGNVQIVPAGFSQLSGGSSGLVRADLSGH